MEGRSLPSEAQDTVLLRRAKPADTERIAAIEQVSFPTPWSRALLVHEIIERDNVYMVAEMSIGIVGFIGLWHVLDEGHICTLAVDPELRGRGLGELLVLAALQEAVKLGADVVHLEYRVSNGKAAALYRKLGFERVGLRRGYYSDTGEDAVLAQIEGLTTGAGRDRLASAWKRWRRERCLQVAAQ
jgi:[ribosomal protein S18]-alanine N-acetyltransferase